MSPATNLAILAGALLIEAVIGYPAALLAAIGHPVMWFGAVLAWLDRSLNRDADSPWLRRVMGALALLMLLAVAVVPTLLLQAEGRAWLPHGLGLLLPTLLASTLFAQRSLWTHVYAVADALDQSGLEGGREAVSHIVGRNPQSLDEAGVVRAAMESLAENFSDAVVAPALWCGVLGLPGIAAYKAINTADSMIGHRTPRHLAFGWAAARLDDVVNLPGSRIAMVWIVLAAFLVSGARPGGALRAVWRDASSHRSPNAGWPEAAMAGALGLRLAGPRVYGTSRVEDGWMGDGRAEATTADLRRALRLFQIACGIQLALALVLAFMAQAFTAQD
jgi:adenosylcobinamide-phosphate synthase